MSQTWLRKKGVEEEDECSKMRWDRLSILMDRVAGVQEQQGFFLQEREGSFLMRQTGLFRTNCIDCLDR